MLISKKHKALVFNAPDPGAITSVVPTARILSHKGHSLVAVPFRIDEVKVMRNLGYAIPSPIGYLYDWPTQYPSVWSHQKETAAFLTLHKRAFVLNEIGTAKTLSALWAADYLLREKVIRRVLVVTPLSTVDDVWGSSIFKHFPDRTFTVLTGTAERRRRLLDKDFDFYIINHDALKIIIDLEYKTKRVPVNSRDPGKGFTEVRKLTNAAFKRDDLDLVIIDELAFYRNGRAAKSELMRKALRPNQWVWGLTGAPTPNEPADAYSQIKIVKPENAPGSFTQFKNETMLQVSEYTWEPRKEAMDIVYRAMQPAVRFTRAGCLDLPETVYSDRSVELTAVQKVHYAEVMKELYTEIAGGEVSAANEGVKQSKLVQIACGLVYGKDKEVLELDAGHRIKALKECIEEAGEKVIVFVPFTSLLKKVHAEVAKDWSAEIVFGDTPPAARHDIFKRFQGTPEPHVLVADARCMAHGLTLTEANTIVWYAPITSNDHYEQANGRITRPGQRNVTNVIHLASTKLERAIYARLKAKGKLQGLLLDMVANGTLAEV